MFPSVIENTSETQFFVKSIKYDCWSNNKKNHTIQICIGNIVSSSFKYAIRGGTISLETKLQVISCDSSCGDKTFSKHFKIHQLRLKSNISVLSVYMDAIQYDKENLVDTTTLKKTHLFSWRHFAMSVEMHWGLEVISTHFITCKLLIPCFTIATVITHTH